MHVKRQRHAPVDAEIPGGNVVIGRIVLIHMDERVRGEDGLCDPAKLDTIARMGGDLYARTTERFTFERPKA